MGSLSFACWALCLAQVALVFARPEFGTSLQFDVSVDLRVVNMRIESLLAALDDDLQFELSEQIVGSEDQRQLLLGFAQPLAQKGTDVTVAFLSTVDASSGGSSAYGPLISAYDALAVFIAASDESFFATVASSFSQLLADELRDSMQVALAGLTNFRQTLDDLQSTLDGSGQYSSEEVAVAHHLLRELLRTMHMISGLGTVGCLFEQVSSNMQAADNFYLAYQANVNSLGERFDDAVTDYGGDTIALASEAGERFGFLSSQYAALAAELSGASMDSSASRSGSSAYDALLLSLEVFTVQGPSALTALLGGASGLLSNYQGGIAMTVGSQYYQPAGLFEAADELVRGLIASGPYAELCFAKYSPLVADVPTLGVLRLHECLDTERPRLRRLMRLVRSFLKLLAYDIEDVLLNLEPCAKRRSRHGSRYFTKLTSFYTALGSKHAYKLQALLQLLLTEFEASLVRTQICLAAANFYAFDDLLPSLTASLQDCYGGDYYDAGSCEQQVMVLGGSASE